MPSGGDYKWVDRKKAERRALAEILRRSARRTFRALCRRLPRRHGGTRFPRWRASANSPISACCRTSSAAGFGYFFLYHATLNAWSKPISKLLVNTCTLDHPRALPLYQRLGFVPYAREDRYHRDAVKRRTGTISFPRRARACSARHKNETGYRGMTTDATARQRGDTFRPSARVDVICSRRRCGSAFPITECARSLSIRSSTISCSIRLSTASSAIAPSNTSSNSCSTAGHPLAVQPFSSMIYGTTRRSCF